MNWKNDFLSLQFHIDNIEKVLNVKKNLILHSLPFNTNGINWNLLWFRKSKYSNASLINLGSGLHPDIQCTVLHMWQRCFKEILRCARFGWGSPIWSNSARWGRWLIYWPYLGTDGALHPKLLQVKALQVQSWRAAVLTCGESLNMGAHTMSGVEWCLAASARVWVPLTAIRAPLARIVFVPMMTLKGQIRIG